MKIFEIDIIKFVKLLLPTFMRGDSIMAILTAGVTPLNSIIVKLNAYRDDVKYQLSITSQVCRLETMLNDRYDAVSRRITISDGSFRDSKYIYLGIEQHDIALYVNSELTTETLYLQSETGAISVDFIVNVPAAITVAENELSVLLNYYKLISKTFTINRT